MSFQILSCRKDIGVYKLPSKHRRRKGDSKEGDVIDLSTLEEYIDRKPSDQVAVFRIAKQKELQEMRELRKRNVSRFNELNTLQPENRQFCLCRKAADGYMLQCELCKEWFHSTCVPLPRTQGSKGNAKSGNETSRTLKYLCLLCHRSRRPRLDTILSLLVSLQKLPVRLVEGEALQFLAECAMNWQDRVRQFLLSDNIARVCQEIDETLKTEPTNEKSTAAMPVTTSTLLQQNIAMAITAQTPKNVVNNANVSRSSTSTQALQNLAMACSTAQILNSQSQEAATDSTSTNACEKKDIHMETEPQSQNSENPSTEIDVVGNSNLQDGQDRGMLGDNEGEVGNMKCCKLTQLELEELEDYMMEGDLLEVTLDESDILWKILVNQRKYMEQKIQVRVIYIRDEL